MKYYIRITDGHSPPSADSTSESMLINHWLRPNKKKFLCLG